MFFWMKLRDPKQGSVFPYISSVLNYLEPLFLYQGVMVVFTILFYDMKGRREEKTTPYNETIRYRIQSKEKKTIRKTSLRLFFFQSWCSEMSFLSSIRFPDCLKARDWLQNAM